MYKRQVYTHVAPDGTNLTLGIQDLLAAIKAARLNAELVTIDHDEVVRIVKNNAVSISKLAELGELVTKGKPIEPIVVCIYASGKAFIVDGHHRLVLAHAMGQKNIGAFICYPPLWEQFIITDVEPLTREQLAAVPHRFNNSSPWKQNQ